VYRSRGGFIRPGQDAQQRRLADAVWPNDAQARAFGNAKREIGENIDVSVGLGEGGDGEQGHFSFQFPVFSIQWSVFRGY
jgi:hypothetical protein